MKRFTALLLAFALMLSLTACSENSDITGRYTLTLEGEIDIETYEKHKSHKKLLEAIDSDKNLWFPEDVTDYPVLERDDSDYLELKDNGKLTISVRTNWLDVIERFTSEGTYTANGRNITLSIDDWSEEELFGTIEGNTIIMKIGESFEGFAGESGQTTGVIVWVFEKQ